MPLPIEDREGHSYKSEIPLMRGKGKERERPSTQDRTSLMEAVLLETEKGMEDSKAWKETNARYPSLKPKQASLVTLLKEVIKKMDKAKARLSGSELLMLHATILQADRQLGNLMVERRRFEESAVAYTYMLKYAFRLRDARALKQIARQALHWQHDHTTKMALNRRKPRFVHPRMAAADDLSRLIRNLFVSLNVEQGVRIEDKYRKITPGVQLPTSKARLQPGDDAMTVSRVLQQRLSAFKLARDDEGRAYVEMSRTAPRSPYPITHQSSKVRWINRMVARGKVDKVLNRLPISEAPEAIHPLPLATETSKEASIPAEPSTSPPILPETTSAQLVVENVQKAENKEGSGIMDLLSVSRGSQLQDLEMNAYRDRVNKWQDRIWRRLGTREKVVGSFKQFKINSSDTAPQTVEAVKRMIPSWLVISLLRLQIEKGNVQRAERVLEIYLQSLVELHKDQKLSEVIPVNAARVHAVTAPFVPPNGSSLLNGLLRAHLNSGAKDCFEAMVMAVHKWAFQAKRFTQCALMKKIERSKNPHIPGHAGCLVPNQDSVMILLEALEKRKQRYLLGKNLVEQMWYRWGIIGLNDERVNEALVEPQRHQALEMPLQAFTKLLKWAKREDKGDRRQKKVNDIIELERKWREKAFGSSQSTFRGASVEHKLAWKRAVGGTGQNDEKEEVEESPPMYFTSNQ
jgi:KaiC/GvpD/RAD55 family RecA-like ATPase